MSLNLNQAVELNKIQKLAMAAATICFLIGWFHSGQGLANYRVLGSEYGGFVLATGLLIIMILAYNKAIKGSNVGLAFYIICAFVTFICNLNSFYPNYRANSLIRGELRDHRTNLGDLRETIKSRFQDAQLNKLAESIRSRSKQVQAQCRQRGFGPLTEQTLKEIEAEVGRSITRLRQGNTQADWDRCADQYEQIIEDELRVKLKENRYLDKLEDIRYAEDNYTLFSKRIDESLATRTELRQVPDYVEDVIKSYRDLCKKATILALEDRKLIVGTPDNKIPENFKCDEYYSSPNTEIGSFSHTFKSVWATKSDGGTLAVLLICLVIDFLFPLALYLLVRTDEQKNSSSRRSGIWKSGGEDVPMIRA